MGLSKDPPPIFVRAGGVIYFWIGLVWAALPTHDQLLWRWLQEDFRD
jgi:hypothetical protein